MNSPNSTGTPTQLFGREEELSRLDEALTGALEGNGSVVVLQGDAGIGKSSLLRAASDRARQLGMAVFAADASLAEADRPLAVARSLIRSVRTGSSEAHGGQDRPGVNSPAEAGRYATEEAILDELDAILTSEPTLITVDDLQWVDEPSSSVIQAIGRRVTDRPVLLLLAGRRPGTGSAYETATAALTHRGAKCIRIAPLSRQVVLQLAEDRLGTAAATLADVLERASGNPFFVNALLDHLTVASAVHAGPSSNDLSLRDAVLGTVISAAAQSREGLRHAAVLGTVFSLTDLAAMAGTQPLEAWNWLEPAIAAGLVEDRGHDLAFRHDLVREALYSEIPGPLRAELHRSAAEALAAAGRDATVVAAHLMTGPPRRDPWAATWLHSAGTEASGVAPATAVRFLRRALELCPPRTAESAEIARDLAMNLVWAAEFGEAERVAVRLRSETADPAVVGPLLLALGWAHWVSGRNLEAARLLTDAAGDADLLAADRAKLAALAGWVTGYQLGRATDARRLASQALSGPGDEVAESMARATLIGLEFLAGRPTQAAEQASRLAARAAAGDPPVLRQLGANTLEALAFIDSDLIERADAAIAQGARLSREAGTASLAAIWHRTRALRHFAVGDWDDAVAELVALSELEADNGRLLGVASGTAIHAMICVHRGDLAAAQELLDRLDAAPRGPEFRGHWVDWARAVHLEGSGDGEGALTVLTPLWQRCQERGPAVDLPWIGPHLTRLAHAVGAADVTERVAEALGRLARNGPPTFQAAAQHCLGLARGDAELLASAATLYRPGRRRFSEATALVDAGEALLAGGDHASAADAIERAMEILRDLGAIPALERAGRLLATTGRSPRRSTRTPRPTVGWASLTPSELRVASLIADGLSNPEIAGHLFVSRRTVESHVARILQKLGLRSRTQVVKAALEADRQL